MYSDAWKKHCDGLPMTPLESQIATIINLHPEYHGDITNDNLDKDYTPDGGKTNPFLHMGLHLSIREQVATDRPPGIARALNLLTTKCGDAHAAEHQMIDCLAETLWEAQSQSSAPDEQKYLDRLHHLTR
jgi:hypothetical protein